jgi:hypothetical protein
MADLVAAPFVPARIGMAQSLPVIALEDLDNHGEASGAGHAGIVLGWGDVAGQPHRVDGDGTRRSGLRSTRV